MKLTRASSYAMQALDHMAAVEEDRPVASHLIARARGIPELYLLKVLKPLVSAGILRSVKGPNGGYRLARPASKITMLEVVEAVDGPVRGEAPLAESGAAGGDKLDARLQSICAEVAEQIRRQLGKVRLADLKTAGR